MTIRPRPGIMDIALYQGGQRTSPASVNVLKLSSNENPYRPLRPKAKEAFSAAAHDAAPLSRRPITPACAPRSARSMASIRRA